MRLVYLAILSAVLAACAAYGDGGNSLGTMPNLLRMTQRTHEAFQGVVFDGAREPLGMPSFQTVLERDEVGLVHAYLVQQPRQATGGG